MRTDYLERIVALCPEIEPGVIKKVIESLQLGFEPKEVTRILGYPDAGFAVAGVRQASLFLVLHRFQPAELPIPPSAAPEQIIDAISEEDQLTLLHMLNEKRGALLAAKVKSL
jgi:hypothetical protein